MTMAACYSNYDLSQGPQHHYHTRQQHQLQAQSHLIPMAVHQTPRLQQQQQQQQASAPVTQKDYSIPLHVDCSVEYELPNQAKPPPGARVEPLLMIHPCYFRKMESQRRSPFVNNMPNSSRNSSSSNALQSSRKSSRGVGAQVITSSVNASSSLGVGDVVSSQQQQQQQQQQQHQQHLQPSQTHQQQQQQQQPPPPQIHHPLSQHIQQQKLSSQMSQQAQYPVAHQTSVVNYMDGGSQCGVGVGGGLTMRHHNRNQNQSTIQMPSTSNKSPSSWDDLLASVAAVNNCSTRISSDNSNSMSTNVIQQQQQQQQHNRNQNQNQSAIQMSASSNKSTSGWDLLASMAAIASNTNATANNNNNNKGISSDNSMTNTNFGLPTPLNVNNTGHSMYSKPVGKRDAMLSGACSIYNTSATVAAASATNNNHAALMAAPMGDLRMCAAGRWEPERSPMAAIPRDYQAGPDATPITSIHDDKSYMLNGKYRQFLRSQRLHPYLMASGAAASTNGSSGGGGGSNTHNSMSFPQLTSSAFQQMQQISCYNV